MKECFSHSIAIHNDTSRPHEQFIPVRMEFPSILSHNTLPWVALPEQAKSGPLCERVALPAVSMSEHRTQMPVQDYILIEGVNTPYPLTSLHMSPRLFVPGEIGSLLRKNEVSEIITAAGSLDLSLTMDGLALSKNNSTTKKDIFVIDHTTGRGITHPVVGSETLAVSQIDPEMLTTAMAHETTKTQARHKFRKLLWEGVQYDQFGHQRLVAAYYAVDYPVQILGTVRFCNMVMEMTDKEKYNGQKLHSMIDPAIIVEYV